MSSKSQPPVHSTSVVYLPPGAHKTTIIMLHGRGSTAQKFAEPLLTHAVSPVTVATISPLESPEGTPKSFREHFQNTKFIFPTAPLRRAVVFNRSLTHQWFDNWSLTQPELKQHLQVPGLRETTAFLHELLAQEIEIVGAKNVVLAGLSQGCAASIIATLLWEGEPFGGLVGMCGYLPFRKGMRDSMEDTQEKDIDSYALTDEEDDIFEHNDDEDLESGTNLEHVIEWLYEELQIPTDREKNDLDPAILSIPLFLGHGADDDKVPCRLGKLAADFLEEIGVNIEWEEYEGLGHWYSEDMLRDVVRFLGSLDGWRSTETV